MTSITSSAHDVEVANVPYSVLICMVSRTASAMSVFFI